jgi:heat shock protein HtpX
MVQLINFVAIVVFEIIFSLLGSLVVARFSRWREFRADAGGARLAGKEKMIHALQSLKGTMEMVDNTHPAITSLKISGKSGGIMALFASHPDLDTRIAALRNGN